MSLLQINLLKNAGNVQVLNSTFNRQFNLVLDLCDEDAEIPDMSKRDLVLRTFEALTLGLPREQLKEEFVLEASYNKEFERVKTTRDRDRRNRSDKKNIRIYGYKYPKTLKFVAQIYKCLKDCFEKRFENLNLDMNYFLLLKNELSLAFLRKFDNILAALKSAIRIYASKEEQSRKEVEAQELQALEKIIKSQSNQGKEAQI